MELNKLFKGCEPESKIKILIKAANIKSPNKKKAIIGHFCQGYSQRTCESLYGISQQTISSAVKKVVKQYGIYCQIAEIERNKSFG